MEAPGRTPRLKESLLDRFGMIMCKNLIHRKRYWPLTLLEIFGPILMALFIMYLGCKTPLYKTETLDDKLFSPSQNLYQRWSPDDDTLPSLLWAQSSIDESVPPVVNVSGGFKVMYYPNSTFAYDMLKPLKDKFPKEVELIGLQSERCVYEKIAQNYFIKGDQNLKGAVLFDVEEGWNETELPAKLSYTLRFPIHMVDTRRLHLPWYISAESVAKSEQRYIESGMLLVQTTLNEAFIRAHRRQPSGKGTPETNDSAIKSTVVLQADTRRIPFPSMNIRLKSNEDLTHATYFESHFPYSLLLHWPILAYGIAYEKERGIEVMLRFLKVGHFMRIFSWMLNSLMTLVPAIMVSSVFLTTNLKTDTSFDFVSVTLLGITLLLYSTASICLTLVISSGSAGAFTSAIAVVSVWLGAIVFSSFYVGPYYFWIPYPWKIVYASLHPNVALFVALRTIFLYYINGMYRDNLDWKNVAQEAEIVIDDFVIKPDDINMMTVLIILGVQSGVYLILLVLTLWLGATPFGLVGRLLNWMWVCGGRSDQALKESLKSEASEGDDEMVPPILGWGPAMEPTPENMRPAVAVEDLKAYSKKGSNEGPLSIKHINLVAMEGQLTFLLGRKHGENSLCLKVLAGLHEPVSGKVLIAKGTDGSLNPIVNYVSGSRCFFGSLTVRENLMFFAVMRGLPLKSLTMTVQDMEEKFSLLHLSNVLASNLPDIMQCRLSICIGLMGKPKILLLDEPTADLSPSIRSIVWECLQTAPSGMAVIVSTSSMDEALTNADRVALIARGRMRCCGSPRFVTTHLGAGYMLRVGKGASCQVKVVAQVVKGYIPDSRREEKIEVEANHELAFFLPNEERLHISPLIDALYAQSEALGVSYVRVQYVHLKDLYHRYEGADVPPPDSPFSSSRAEDLDEAETATSLAGALKLVARTMNMQFWVLIRKSFLHLMRWSGLIATQYLILFGFATMSTFTTRGVEMIAPLLSAPTMNMSTTGYDRPWIVMDTSGNPSDSFGQFYKAELDTYAGNRKIENSYANLETGFKELGKHKLQYAQHCLGGADFSKEDNGDFNYTVWYNPYYPHSAALGINWVSNARLKYFTKSRSVSIDTQIHPVEDIQTVLTHFIDAVPFRDIDRNAMMSSLWLAIGLIQLVSGFVAAPAQEQRTLSAKVQKLSGIGPCMFWITRLFSDFLWWIPATAGVLLILILGDSHDHFDDLEYLAAAAMLLLLYGCSALVFGYFFSFCCNTQHFSAKSSVMFLILFHLWTGVLFGAGIHSTYFSPNTKMLAETILWAMLCIFPSLTMMQGLINLFTLSLNNHRCQFIPHSLVAMACSFLQRSGEDVMGQTCADVTKHTNFACCSKNTANTEVFFSFAMPMDRLHMWGSNCFFPERIDDGKVEDKVNCEYHFPANVPGMMAIFAMLVFQALFYFLCVLLIEKGIFRHLYNYILGKKNTLQPYLGMSLSFEPGVRQERVAVSGFVRRGGLHQRALVLYEMTKVYKKKTAWRGSGDWRSLGYPLYNLSLSVQHGEIVGVVGPVGAGKTTLVRILTGQTTQTHGDAFLFGTSLQSDPNKFLSMVGYSPAHEGLVTEMTGRETVALMGQLRGVCGRKLKHEISRWCKDFGILEKELNRECRLMGVAHRRILSIFSAVVGRPPLVVLHEPTKGLGPRAKARLLAALLKNKKKFRACLVVSSSVEDCQNLCQRIGVMIDGYLMCLQSPEELQVMFGTGYLVKLLLHLPTLVDAPYQLQQLCKDMAYHFRPCHIIAEGPAHMFYHLSNPELDPSAVFTTMESFRQQFRVLEDYTINESSAQALFNISHLPTL